MTKNTYNITSSVLSGVAVGVGMYFDLTILEQILVVIILPGSFLFIYRKKLKKWKNLPTIFKVRGSYGNALFFKHLSVKHY